MPRGIKNVPPASAPDNDTDDATSAGKSFSLLDEFAMRAMAAILTGIATSGGLAGVSVVSCNDDLLRKAYDFADSAMRVRAGA